MTTTNNNENTIIGQILRDEQAFLASPTINYTELGERFGATFEDIQLFIEAFCLAHPGVFVTNGHLVDLLTVRQACMEQMDFQHQYEVDEREKHDPSATPCYCPMCQPF